MSLKKLIVQVHLWLGLGLSILLLVWFVSGYFMMYSGYTTRVAPGDRLERLAPLRPGDIQLTPNDAMETAGVLSMPALRLEMLLGAPVYRFPAPGGGWLTVRADTAAVVEPLSLDEARAAAVDFFGGGDPVLDRVVDRADLWTLDGVHRDAFPMFRFRMGDDAATLLHVSPGNAEVANRTTRRERVLAFTGAVLHFLYVPQLRREPGNPRLWLRLVVALSGLGAFLCLTGLILGVIYLRPRSVVQDRRLAWSPFVGLMKWHHYLGLAFGLVAFTWTLSGMLSLDPGYDPSPSPRSAERAAVAGGPLYPWTFRLPVQDAIARAQDRMTVKQVEWLRFRGVPYYLLRESPDRTLLVRADRGEAPEPVERVSMDELAQAARFAFARHAVLEETVLDRYDLYYYGRDRPYGRAARPRLPVLRIKFDDPGRTWLYMDPFTASIAARRDRVSRTHRWVFNFLHSFDLPALLRNRPAWDLLVLVLMAGGTALAASGVWLTLRWIGTRLGRR